LLDVYALNPASPCSLGAERVDVGNHLNRSLTNEKLVLDIFDTRLGAREAPRLSRYPRGGVKF